MLSDKELTLKVFEEYGSYAMSEACGVSEFVRKYTLSSGGPYCDCGYKKRRAL